MKHICNFSGGLGSFFATKRVIEQHGPDVQVIFADTLAEDDCLYDFLRASERLLGITIIKISEGLDPWALFRREGCIGTSAHPICSHLLKREPLDRWMRENALELDTTLYVGFDWTELHRVESLRNKKPQWRIEAPMTEAPFWSKCQMIKEAKRLGLPPQLAYEQGFPHNNCGRRCVAAGISHWVHLFKVDPIRYMEWEREENDTIEILAARGIKAFTMLKDRRGGITNNLSLTQLRLRIESGEQFPKYEWGGCGCAGAVN